MSRGYYYDFVGKISNDPALTPEQVAELEKHIEIRDPLNGGKVVEGVISYDVQNRRLDKWKMFKGEKLMGTNGLPEVEIISRPPPQPAFYAVRIKPEAAPNEAKPPEQSEPEMVEPDAGKQKSTEG